MGGIESWSLVCLYFTMAYTKAACLLLGFAMLTSLAASQRPTPSKAEAEQVHLTVTPTIMTAILVGFLWLSLFLTGFCCLFQVQTPQTYEEKCLTLNKQY